MIVLEYKIKGKSDQYKAIDQAIRTTQFIRNKAIRYWMDAPPQEKVDKFTLNKYSTILRNQFPFVADLNSTAVQSAAERGWSAISRFYDNYKKNISGKKGYPRFQKDCRSVEYKQSGWKLHPTKRQITLTDKNGIGKLKCTSNDVVVYEDLSVRNLVKNHCLAKSIIDASWYLFRRWIEYFAGKFDKLAIPVAPHYTSQKCSNCGVIVKKSLSTRTHICSCGCELHRDTNAAINILNLGKQARDGQSQSNAVGVDASTLLGGTLVEQVLTLNTESSLSSDGESVKKIVAQLQVIIMKLSLQAILSDPNFDVSQATSQRQLAISISAFPSQTDADVPLNLCLILDHSGSMSGKPLETVKQAAIELVDRLKPGDRISIITFDHRAKVLIPNQDIKDLENIKRKINGLKTSGGTAIDEGLKLGIEELGKGKAERISQAFLLTDGENEHGDNTRCLKLAKLAANYNLTINTLGFGEDWNSDVLEEIADAAGGTLAYIEYPEQAIDEFSRLFNKMQSVGLTNAYLLLDLMPNVRLAELKPIAQVAPDTIELPVQKEGDKWIVRLGDVMKDVDRVVLANLYFGKFSEGKQAIAQVQVRYDDPSLDLQNLYSDAVLVEGDFVNSYQPKSDPFVQQQILALAKYRQTQIAETKLQQGDRAGAATMLQTAAKTALQMGDKSAATVLQTSATRLQSGEELSEADKKKTRIVSKTVLK